MSAGPHITELQVENVKRLRAVRITPGGRHLVAITGANGSGKTSVLDAIYWALAGKGAVEAQPIRRGEESATIRLSLGEVVVTRSFTEKGSTLVVEAASGARFPSPQRMLDELLGSLTFDPLAFERMAPKDRLEELRRIAPQHPQIPQWEQEAARAFEERTLVNREVRNLEGKLAGEKPVDLSILDRPAPDLTGLMNELETIGKHNAAVDAEAARRAAVLDEIGRAHEEAADLMRRADALLTKATGMQEEFDALDALPDRKDAAEVRARIEEARGLQQMIREAEARRALEAELADRRALAEKLTAVIEDRQKAVAAAVAETAMPVPGLAFGAGDVLFNGLPFDQASAAERLRVSLSIAMAMNPKLRVVRIKDGSLLDERSLELVAEMAAAADYQVWIERVDTSGAMGVVMEDGEVKVDHGAPADG